MSKLFCCHDWEVVESVEKWVLKEKAIAECKGENYVEWGWCMLPDYHHKMVCLKCGKIRDEITPAIERCTRDYHDQKRREKLARELITIPNPSSYKPT